MCLISVITSVYNSEKYLKSAIESILHQTFVDFEFIIVNDGSTDSSKDIINKYALQDNRIIVIHQENIGLTKSLNKAIHLSRGKYIARIDADDIAEPNRLEIQFNFLQNNPIVDLVASNYYLIDSNGNRILYRQLPGVSVIRKTLRKHNLIAHSTVMFKKSSFELVGGYNEIYRYSQDWDLWQRFNTIDVIYEPLVNWRIHSSNINFNKNNRNIHYDDYFLINIISMHLEQYEKEKAKVYINLLKFSPIKLFYSLLCLMPRFIVDIYFWKFRIFFKEDFDVRINEINNRK